MSGADFEVPGLKRIEIRRFAQVFRAALQQREARFDVIHALEFGLLELIPDFEFLCGDLESMGPDHGVTIPTKRIVRIREDVYLGAIAESGRDRLTICHEFGHLLLHDDLAFARRVVPRSVPAYRSSEWQANCFAGELLMDQRFISATDSEADLVNRFGVSWDAASYQLSVLKREGLR